MFIGENADVIWKHVGNRPQKNFIHEIVLQLFSKNLHIFKQFLKSVVFNCCITSKTILFIPLQFPLKELQVLWNNRRIILFYSDKEVCYSCCIISTWWDIRWWRWIFCPIVWIFLIRACWKTMTSLYKINAYRNRKAVLS